MVVLNVFVNADMSKVPLGNVSIPTNVYRLLSLQNIPLIVLPILIA